MARASYITIRNGRYWFQARFDPCRDPGDPIRHLRFALRTADYTVAVRRMVAVMTFITQFKINPDCRSRATGLLAQIVQALDAPPPFSVDQRVAWEALERVTHRFIGGAMAVDHPIGVHAPAFWTCWRRFVERNARLEDAARRGVDLEPSLAGEEQSALPHFLQNLTEKAVPLSMLRRRVLLDHDTDIESISTTWCEEEAAVVYVDGAAGVLTGPRGDVAVRIPAIEAPAGSATPDETSSNPARQSATNSSGPSLPLSEAIRQRLDGLAITLGDRRADESHGRVLQFALDLLGDVGLSTIQVDDLRRLEIALTEIPNRKGIPKVNAVSLHSRYVYAKTVKQKSLTKISQTTLVNTYYGSMNSFLEWCRTKTRCTIPAFKFDQKSDAAPAARDRDAFRDEELLRFFSLPLFTGCASPLHIWQPGKYFIQNDLYWGFIIHVFMGLRPSEIGQLQTDDIVQADARMWIDLTDDAEANAQQKRLKSKAARRRVPIPRLLIDLGLLDRKSALEADGVKRLFPNWTIYQRPKSKTKMYGHYLSKSWQYVKIAHGFTRANLTLYSGRHTLAGWYDAMRLPDRIRKRLLGHAGTSVAHDYGPIALTSAEAHTVPEDLQIQVDVADILLKAKLQADYAYLVQAPGFAINSPQSPSNRPRTIREKPTCGAKTAPTRREP